MEIVELRVHGVHGTSPGSMLGVDGSDVQQVAGDSLTGIYRADGNLPYRRLEGTDVSVEAYSWGALTSGVQGLFGWVKRALWLLLLPFALANLSYWARLHMAEDTATARWGARATRIGAVLLTMFMVLTPCLLAIDLVAWQCYRGDSPGCPALPGLLDFLARLDSAERLAVGSLVPLAVVALLWFLSRQSMIRYEEVVAVAEEGKGAPTMTLDSGRVDVLRHPRLWQGKDRTLQLQRIHLTVALGVVVAFTGAHVVALPSANPPLATTSTIVAVVLMVTAGAWTCIIHPDDIDYFEHSHSRITAMRRAMVPARLRRFVRTALPEWLLRLMAATTAVHLLALAFATDPLDDKGDFLGRNLWFIGVFVLLTAVHLSVFMGGRMSAAPAVGVVFLVLLLAAYALVVHWYRLDNETHGWAKDLYDVRHWVGFGSVVVLWGMLSVWHLQQGRRHRAEAWNGAGASFMLAAAAWVGLLFTTGLVTATADFLNGDGHGVDDLVTVTEPIGAGIAPARPVLRPAQRELTATGDVVARDAVIVRSPSGGGLTLVAGKVQSESLFEPAADRDDGLLLSLDSIRVSNAQISTPSPLLAVEDVCVREAGHRSTSCSAEDADYVAAGTLPLPGQLLQVDGPVTLTVTKPPQMPLAIPQVLIWSPLLQFVWLIAVVVFAGVALLVFGRTRRAFDDFVDQDGAVAERDKAAVKGSRRWAALAHRAETLLDVVGAITAVLAILVIVFSATGEPPWAQLPWTRNIATLSMYVVLALGAGLVWVASRLRTSDQARKGLGVLWDLTTFWPRAAHPLAPPCYAERVVPELRTRVNWALGSAPDTRVILSGHSQGSAILAALVSRLSRRDLARIRVVTYGSQIRALYGRVFPRVLGPEAIGYVPTPGPAVLWDPFPDAPPPKGKEQDKEKKARDPYAVPAPDPDLVTPAWEQLPLFDRVFTAGAEWANLFRRTDPLGFRVFSDADLPPDHPVPEVPPREAGDPGPRVQGHSGYQHTLVYRRLVQGWTGEPLVEPSTSTKDVPFLPVD